MSLPGNVITQTVLDCSYVIHICGVVLTCEVELSEPRQCSQGQHSSTTHSIVGQVQTLQRNRRTLITREKGETCASFECENYR